MKPLCSFLALHSAGALSHLLSAATTLVSALSEQTQQFVPAGVPPPSDASWEESSRSMLTERRLSPFQSYSPAQRRALPWQAPRYESRSELPYLHNYLPSLHNGQYLISPYDLPALNQGDEGESVVSSALRHAIEIDAVPHLQFPVWSSANGADFEVAPGFPRGLPTSDPASSLRVEPVLSAMRLMREEKEERAAEEQEAKDVHEDGWEKKDDAEVEKKKKKKKDRMHWAHQAKQTVSWGEDEGEDEQNEGEKDVQHKEHAFKVENISKQHGGVGGEGDDKQKAGEGRGEAKKKASSSAGAGGEIKSSRDVPEVAPPPAVEASYKEKHQGSRARRDDGVEKTVFAVDEPHSGLEKPKKMCAGAGVCRVNIQKIKKTKGQGDVDGDIRNGTAEGSEVLPFEKKVSGEKPGDSARSEASYAVKREPDGQEQAEWRVKRSPESSHYLGMDRKILKEPSEAVRRMKGGWNTRSGVFYYPSRTYVYYPYDRPYWDSGYDRIYYRSPRVEYYYPVNGYHRWLRRVAESDRQVDVSDQPLNDREVHLTTHF